MSEYGKIRKISRFPRADRIYPGKPVAGLPGAVRAGARTKDLLPEQVKVMARLIGTTRAKRIWKLMQSGVEGTLPELCTWAWLVDRHISFTPESVLLGGRWEPGGAVVDYLIHDATPAGYYIWRVQGTYWHSGLERSSKDAIQKFRLEHTTVGGIPIVAVVDLWEDQIYNNYPDIFLQAEMGQTLARL